MKYGLSIGLCFADMAAGQVNPKFVIKIIARSRIVAHELDERVIAYRNSDWAANPDEAERLFREFWAAGKIEQPRLTMQKRCPDTRTTGHWVDSLRDIRWLSEEELLMVCAGDVQ